MQIDLEQKISDLKEKRRAEYLKRAEGDIKEIEKDEKIKACIKLSAIEGVNRKKIERIEEIYRKNKEAWAESIVKRVIEKYGVEPKNVAKEMKNTDKKRAKFHNFYSEEKWGEATTYDLAINVAKLGIDGTVDLISEYIKAQG